MENKTKVFLKKSVSQENNQQKKNDNKPNKSINQTSQK